MAVTAFTTGEQLTQARLAVLTGEIDALHDARPASPNAADEEFDSGVGGFVTLNGSGLTVSTNRSRLILAQANTVAFASGPKGVVKPCAAGTWRYEVTGCRMSPIATGSMGLGVRRGGGTAPNVANTTTDAISYLMVDATANNVTLLIQRWTGSTVYSTYEVNINAVAMLAANGFAIAYDGTNFGYYISADDGASWRKVYSVAAATVIGGAPDSIAILTSAGAGQGAPPDGCVASFEAFRRVA